MIIAFVVAVVVAVVAVGALIVVRRRADELAALVEERGRERTAALDAAEVAATRTRAVEKERDDALERVNRARRDAAEVANRLRDEADLRAVVEEELATVRAELDAHECPAPEAVDSEDAALQADVLWALALGQTEQTWRVSLSLGHESDSPLRSSADLFRAAVEIEVEAAREEAGADVDLRWEGLDREPPAHQAVLAWALVRDVIGRFATRADRTELVIDRSEDHVDVRVTVTGPDGAGVAVALPAPIEVEPGVARIS